jgi:hypothetical protein
MAYVVAPKSEFKTLPKFLELLGLGLGISSFRFENKVVDSGISEGIRDRIVSASRKNMMSVDALTTPARGLAAVGVRSLGCAPCPKRPPSLC